MNEKKLKSYSDKNGKCKKRINVLKGLGIKKNI